MKVRFRFGVFQRRGAVLAGALLATCCGSAAGSSSTTTPEPSRTPDAANLVRTYVTMLSKDLSPLHPADVACRASADACRMALDQAAVVAAKVGDDLQHTTAEPDAIEKPVEDIRASARFVISVDRDFDAGTMPVSEAANAYMAEFNTLEQALRQLQAAD